MVNEALLRELNRKKFMKKTKYLEWEETKKMAGHRQRIKQMKAAVDNNLPNQGPRNALEQKKERMAKHKLHQLQTDNLWFLSRLNNIKNRKPGSLWRRRMSGLMRGDSYILRPPATKLVKYNGKVKPPFQSTKRMEEQVAHKVVSIQHRMSGRKIEGDRGEGDKWLKKWLARDTEEIGVDILDYSKASPRTVVLSPRKDKPFKEPEVEELAPYTAKLSLRDKATETSPRTPLWEWDATPRTSPLNSSRWSSPRSGSRWTSPRTPPSSQRWSFR